MRGVRPTKPSGITRYKLSLIATTTNPDLLDGSIYPSRRLNDDEIRILELRPARYGQPISCNVKIFRLAESTMGEQFDWPDFCEFEALSYTWGPTLEGHTIRLNGCYNLPVTDNLWYALQRLRWVFYTRRLWIDAITINQADDVEKGEQVRKMLRIYRCAKRTLVWLGEPTRPALPGRESKIHTPQFLQEQQASAPERCAQPRGYQDGYLPASILRYTIDLPFHAHDILARRRDVESFRNLEAALASTSTHWYTRMWVVQEFAAVQNVQFLIGPSQLELEEFDPEHNPYAKTIIDRMSMQSPHNAKLPANFKNLKDTIGANYRPSGSSNLIKLLYQLRGFESTNPRDRIYGILGLLSREHAALIQVDYARPCGLVFAQATFSQIRMSGDLNILTQVRFDQVNDGQLPSWALDCQLQSDLVPFPMRPIMQQMTPNPSYTKGVFSVTLHKSWRYLTLKGRLLDQVAVSKGIFKPFPPDAAALSASNYDSTDEQLYPDQETACIGDRTLPTPFAKPAGSTLGNNTRKYTHLASLAGNDLLYRDGNDPSIYANGDRTDPSARIALCFPECQLGTLRHQNALAAIDKMLLASAGQSRPVVTTTTRSPMQTEILQTLYAYAFTVSGGASAFITLSYSLAGFGPAGMREGDSIVLLRGCRLPVVLRPGEKEGTWLFRGFVYVHRVVDYEYYSRQLKEKGDGHKKDPEMRFTIFPEYLKGEEEDEDIVLA